MQKRREYEEEIEEESQSQGRDVQLEDSQVGGVGVLAVWVCLRRGCVGFVGVLAP